MEQQVGDAHCFLFRRFYFVYVRRHFYPLPPPLHPLFALECAVKSVRSSTSYGVWLYAQRVGACARVLGLSGVIGARAHLLADARLCALWCLFER